MDLVSVCVFAKPPVPGRVKTRIGAVVGHELACALASALLEDVADVVRATPGTRLVIATTDPSSSAFGPMDAEYWNQGEGELGARIGRTLRRGIEVDGGAIALGADTVGLTPGVLERAVACVRAGRPVMGPSRDGGFYLLGLPACPHGLLVGVPWSESVTGDVARQRVREAVDDPLMLPMGEDLDELDDLGIFVAAVEAGRMDGGRVVVVARDILARAAGDV